MRRFLLCSLALLGTAMMLAVTVPGSSAPVLAATAPRLLTYITGLGTSKASYVVLATLSPSGRVRSTRPLGPATSALLSPNGAEVAAVSQGKGTSAVTLYSTSGGGAWRLPLSSEFMTLLAWSPDSALLLLAVGDSPKSQLVVFNVVTRTTTTVATGGSFYGASFEPGGQNDIVYALASTPDASTVNLYITTASGTGTRQVTNDGRSEEPVWGPNGIAYSRVAPPAKGGHTPELQLWMIQPAGGDPRLLSGVPAGTKLTGSTPSGLTAVGFSVNGDRLLANFVPSDEGEAYVLGLSGGKVTVRDLTGQGKGTIGDAISLNGQVILLTTWSPTDLAAHSVETVKWSGKPTVIVKNGAYASWDQ